MYPLLRSLEARGSWRGSGSTRSAARGASTGSPTRAEEERKRLAGELAPRLDRIAASIEAIRAELAG